MASYVSPPLMSLKTFVMGLDTHLPLDNPDDLLSRSSTSLHLQRHFFFFPNKGMFLVLWVRTWTQLCRDTILPITPSRKDGGIRLSSEATSPCLFPPEQMWWASRCELRVLCHTYIFQVLSFRPWLAGTHIRVLLFPTTKKHDFFFS